ncbi:hypothetical protein CORC01_12160 [Colletotrichum orchidophilum]|uniref:Uncharacterized protein n=1 Tax=Colletotrichum orchidophilum TaxID=1209926 RepID=A0A1G4ATS8_9PEZI|nr:uncharacterized protein CORC01_12160 [Colletotrichum orchidophilum]OHE92511.1 hypothetical protein CORC01_12160 [Colletotrichum orchidophilum]
MINVNVALQRRGPGYMKDNKRACRGIRLYRAAIMNSRLIATTWKGMGGRERGLGYIGCRVIVGHY